MTDDEDDYLSEKFLLESDTTGRPRPQIISYLERRKQARYESELRNAQNRKKSRRKLEEEAREEGLKKSLFDRAKEEEQELGAKSKAMDLMLKMGFKPGQSLGVSDGAEEGQAGWYSEPISAPSSAIEQTTEDAINNHGLKDDNKIQHRIEPLSIDFWSGKQGLGLGKRALSPGASEPPAKASKLDEEVNKETYRSRAREEYEERRAEGRLLSATRTLLELDEDCGVQLNVLSLNPNNAETFPHELSEKLKDYAIPHIHLSVTRNDEAEHEKLRQQMRFDALQSLDVDVDDDGPNDDRTARKLALKVAPLPEEFVEEAAEFLRLNARLRLQRVLIYLRRKYHYCFWCGMRYDDSPDLNANCPGEEEDAH